MSESPTQTQTPTNELFEQQMRTLERGQRMLTRSTMVPFRQAAEVQWNLGEMFLRGLELNESLQRMNADVTRSAFRSYMDSFEDVATDVTRQAGQMGQGTPGSQPAPVSQQSQRGSEPPYGQGEMPPQQVPPQPPTQQVPSQPPTQQVPPQQTPPQQSTQQAPPQQSTQQVPPQPPTQQAPPQQSTQQAPPQQSTQQTPAEPGPIPAEPQ